MNNVCALFSLFMAMATNFHQRFNHPFKSIHFIIPYNQGTWFFDQNFRFMFLDGLNVVFSNPHLQMFSGTKLNNICGSQNVREYIIEFNILPSYLVINYLIKNLGK